MGRLATLVLGSCTLAAAGAFGQGSPTEFVQRAALQFVEICGPLTQSVGVTEEQLLALHNGPWQSMTRTDDGSLLDYSWVDDIDVEPFSLGQIIISRGLPGSFLQCDVDHETSLGIDIEAVGAALEQLLDASDGFEYQVSPIRLTSGITSGHYGEDDEAFDPLGYRYEITRFFPGAVPAEVVVFYEGLRFHVGFLDASGAL